MTFSPKGKTLLIELEAIKVALQYRRMYPTATHHAILAVIMSHCRTLIDPDSTIKFSVIRELVEWTVTAELSELDQLIHYVYYDITPNTDQPVIAYSENLEPWIILKI